VDLRAVSGLDLALDGEALALAFGSDVVHPDGERRHLSDVRATLADPGACGPDHLYTIYMDVCRVPDHAALVDQLALYGAVVYNHGRLGRERLRSQGHRHSRKLGTSRAIEVYEFWTATASCTCRRSATRS
jgi:glucose-6-phosphate isomerase